MLMELNTFKHSLKRITFWKTKHYWIDGVNNANIRIQRKFMFSGKGTYTYKWQ